MSLGIVRFLWQMFASDIKTVIFSVVIVASVHNVTAQVRHLLYWNTHTMFAHAFNAISQGIERVPRVESSHYCRVGRSFSTCVLHTRGSSLQMSGRCHKSACEEISMEMEVSKVILAVNKVTLVPALWMLVALCLSIVSMCLKASEVLLKLCIETCTFDRVVDDPNLISNG